MYNLKGRVALVTGAARMKGIGRAVALRLAQEGADIAVQGRYRSPDRFPEWEKEAGYRGLDSIVEEVEAISQKGLAVVGDVSVKAEVEKMLAMIIDKFGHIDILVNNASLHSMRDRSSILGMPEEMWNSYFSTNLNGTLFVSQITARYMKERGQGGKIIIVSSASANRPSKDNAHYSISKLAMIGLNQSMALELAQYKINVNAIMPNAITLSADGRGQLYTNAVHDGLTEEQVMARIFPAGASRIPLGRQGLPSDIASLVAFLVSSEADYITGQVIACNGGASLMH